MWRSEQQTNDAIFLLLDLCGLPALQEMWTREGPTELAWDLHERNGGYLSSGERRMLLVAFELANRTMDRTPQKVGLSDVACLGASRARLVCTLTTALATSMAEVDVWIGRHAALAPLPAKVTP